MTWLVPSVIATLAGTAVLSFTYWYLYFQDRQRYIAIWAAGWSICFLRYIFTLWMIIRPNISVLLIANQVASLLSGVFLLWGTYQFIDKRFPKLWVYCFGFGTAWIIFSVMQGFSFSLTSIPTFTFLAVVYIWTGSMLIKSRITDGYEKTITGWTFIIWGVHKANFPFLRPVVWFAHWGYILSALLEFVVALGMLFVYFHKTQKSLLESERNYRNIFENAVEGFYQSIPGGRFISVNPAFVRIFGYDSVDELLSRNFDIREQFYVNTEDRSRWKDILKKDGTVKNFEFKAKRKDGSHIWVCDSTRALFNQDGEIIRYEGNVFDINDRKLSEQATHNLNERFILAADSAGIGIWDLDIENDILVWDEWMYRIYGITPDDFEGASHAWEKCIHPDDFLHVDREVQQAIQGAQPFDTKFRIVRPDGEIRYIKAFGRVVRDAEGKPAKMIGINSDVTEHEQAEAHKKRIKEELLRRNHFIETILDNLPIGLAVHHNDRGEATYFNRRFEEIYGWPKEEIDGFDDFFEKVYPDASYRAKVKSKVLTDIQSGDPQRMEWEGAEVTGKDGQKKIVYAKNIPIAEQNLMISTVQDITERKNLQARLQKAQKMEAIGNLAGGIAHDFNNILSPILGFSEILMAGIPCESPEHDFAKEIYIAGKRGSDLVNQILAFSRQSEHIIKPVHIQQVLQEVLKLSRSTIPANIEIIDLIKKDCRPVLADPTQLHQIAMNLITNAYHAVEPTGGTITVRLNETTLAQEDLSGSSLAPGRYAVITLSDTGSGIDPSIMNKIFDPYFTTKEHGKGTGLGLAVVYGIVKEHGGEIKVCSEPGRGTAFNVYFPLIESTPECLELQKAERLQGGSERILLVDDEAPIARLGKQMLENLGYQVTMRTSSIEALEVFKAKPHAFDLVISDMAMPNMTGERLASEVIAVRPDIAIIICTGFSARINRENAEADGIKGFLMKPVVRSEMARMVRKILDEGNA